MGLKFRGEQQDFEEMIGNLIDNACKWARSEVRVTVAPGAVVDDERWLTVLIDDDGPGLSDAEIVEVTRRGRKLDETKPGSGLGLSIVTDLAEIYGGTFTMRASPLGGLRAELILPAV